MLRHFYAELLVIMDVCVIVVFWLSFFDSSKGPAGMSGNGWGGWNDWRKIMDVAPESSTAVVYDTRQELRRHETRHEDRQEARHGARHEARHEARHAACHEAHHEASSRWVPTSWERMQTEITDTHGMVMAMVVHVEQSRVAQAALEDKVTRVET
jgi:hypothetical protein